MFSISSVMVLTDEEILRVEIDSNTQKSICETFADALNNLTADKTRVIFDGSYKPNEDKFLTIENFQLSDEIKDAIRNPIGVKAFQKSNGEFPEIKSNFVGERTENGKAKYLILRFRDLGKNNIFQRNGVIYFLMKRHLYKKNDME